jgi:hypothetical protein
VRSDQMASPGQTSRVAHQRIDAVLLGSARIGTTADPAALTGSAAELGSSRTSGGGSRSGRSCGLLKGDSPIASRQPRVIQPIAIGPFGDERQVASPFHTNHFAVEALHTARSGHEPLQDTGEPPSARLLLSQATKHRAAVAQPVVNRKAEEAAVCEEEGHEHGGRRTDHER